MPYYIGIRESQQQQARILSYQLHTAFLILWSIPITVTVLQGMLRGQLTVDLLHKAWRVTTLYTYKPVCQVLLRGCCIAVLYDKLEISFPPPCYHLYQNYQAERRETEIVECRKQRETLLCFAQQSLIRGRGSKQVWQQNRATTTPAPGWLQLVVYFL